MLLDFTPESIIPFVFPLVVCLTRVEVIALGPFCLGPLFHHLDQIHSSVERSLGHFDMASMLHTHFLLAFFYKRFLITAPVPRTFRVQGAAHFWTEWWSGASSKVPWVDYCDCEGNFLSRPYTSRVVGIIGNEDFLPSARAHVSAVQAIINFFWMTFLR